MQKIEPILKILLLTFLLLSCSNTPNNHLEVYQLANEKWQVLYMNCRCKHDCYFVVTHEAIYWYAEAHIKRMAEYSHSKDDKKFFNSLEDDKLVFIEYEDEVFSNIMLGKQKLKSIQVGQKLKEKMLNDLKTYKK